MDDVKRTYREGEQDTKEAWRKADGDDSLADAVGNAATSCQAGRQRRRRPRRRRRRQHRPRARKPGARPTATTAWPTRSATPATTSAARHDPALSAIFNDEAPGPRGPRRMSGTVAPSPKASCAAPRLEALRIAS